MRFALRSPALVAASKRHACNTDVATVYDIRRANLLRLVNEAGGQAALAERIETNPVYVNQLVRGAPDSRTGRPRQIGDAIARRLERTFGKPHGWMDSAHHAAEPPAVYRMPAPPPSDFAEPRVPTDSEWQLLQDLRAMPAEDREALMRDVHAQAEKFRRLVAEHLASLRERGIGY